MHDASITHYIITTVKHPCNFIGQNTCGIGKIFTENYHGKFKFTSGFMGHSESEHSRQVWQRPACMDHAILHGKPFL